MRRPRLRLLADETMMSTPAEPYAWVLVDAPYLREQAQRCARLARDCSKMSTENIAHELKTVVHELEAIGIELMQKARELDHLQGDQDTSQSTLK
jgi:hypothetical protein